MRYTRIAHASWLIGIVLVVMAVIFASWRSRDVPTPNAPTRETTKGWDGMTAAGAIFDTECAACHPGGELLRGRAVELYESRDGRTYLVRFMLSGEIRSVSGGTESFAAGHPSFKHLSDQSIADVINFMLRAWGNDALSAEEPPLYDASEVESSR